MSPGVITVLLSFTMIKQNWRKIFSKENFLRHETAVVDKLESGVRNKWLWPWLDCQDANEDFYASYISSAECKTSSYAIFLRILLCIFSITE